MKKGFVFTNRFETWFRLDCGEFSGGTVAEDMRADAYDVWGNHTANDLEQTLEDLFTANISQQQEDHFFKDGALFGSDDDAPFNMLWTQIPQYLIPEGVQNTQGKFQHISF